MTLTKFEIFLLRCLIISLFVPFLYSEMVFNQYASFQVSESRLYDQENVELDSVLIRVDVRRAYEAAYNRALPHQKAKEQFTLLNERALERTRDNGDFKPYDRSLSQAEKDIQIAWKPYNDLVESYQAPIRARYASARERAGENSFLGKSTANSIGIIFPFAAIVVVFFGYWVEKGENQWLRLSIALVAQGVSGYFSGYGASLKFESLHAGIAIGMFVFLVYPFAYEYLTKAFFLTRNIKRRKLADLAYVNEIKKRRLEKLKSEKSRVANVLEQAKELVGEKNNGVSLHGVPTNPREAAKWFVEKGAKYGMATKIAKHCNVSNARFSQLVASEKQIQDLKSG